MVLWNTNNFFSLVAHIRMEYKYFFVFIFFHMLLSNTDFFFLHRLMVSKDFFYFPFIAHGPQKYL